MYQSCLLYTSLSVEEIQEARRKFDAKMLETGDGLVMVPNVDGKLLKQSVKETWKCGKLRKIPYMLGVVTDDLGAVPDVYKRQSYDSGKGSVELSAAAV